MPLSFATENSRNEYPFLGRMGVMIHSGYNQEGIID